MRKEESKQKTIASLLNIARKHFTKYGYYDISLEKIAKEGNVTRGAVYHHFKNKEGLFLAILELVQKDVAEEIEREASKSNDLWQQLILGCLGFIKAANKEDSRRILLVDAPVVVGWKAWREVDQENSMSVLLEHILELKKQGYLKEDVNLNWMTYSLSGALNELALNYPQGDKTDEECSISQTIEHLVSGFRKNS